LFFLVLGLLCGLGGGITNTPALLCCVTPAVRDYFAFYVKKSVRPLMKIGSSAEGNLSPAVRENPPKESPPLSYMMSGRPLRIGKIIPHGCNTDKIGLVSSGGGYTDKKTPARP